MDRVNDYASAPSGKLLTQAIDIDLNGVGASVLSLSKQLVLKISLWHDLTMTLHQQLQQVCLALRKDLRPAIDEDLSTPGIECQVADVNRATNKLCRMVQNRL